MTIPRDLSSNIITSQISLLPLTAALLGKKIEIIKRTLEIF